jgi:hypothetical protein
MRVSAHNWVWVEHAVVVENHSCQVLQVNLVDYAWAWWHDFEVVKGLGTPLEELESFLVSIKFKSLIDFSSILSSGFIHLDWVVNDQLNWCLWVDSGWISTESLDGISHGSEIYDGWYSTIKRFRGE